MLLLLSLLLSLALGSYETCIKACGPAGSPTYRQCALACNGQRKTAVFAQKKAAPKRSAPKRPAAGSQKKKKKSGKAAHKKDAIYDACIKRCGPRTSPSYRQCALGCSNGTV